MSRIFLSCSSTLGPLNQTRNLLISLFQVPTLEAAIAGSRPCRIYMCGAGLLGSSLLAVANHFAISLVLAFNLFLNYFLFCVLLVYLFIVCGVGGR